MSKIPQGARLKRAAPAAPQGPVQQMGLPRRVGAVVATPYMTDDELKQIRKIAPGFKKGDPLPDDFADQLDAQLQAAREQVSKQARYEAQTMLPVRPDTPPLADPEEISIDQLPESRRRELEDYIKASQEKYKNRSKVAKATAHLDPTIAAAYAEAIQEESALEDALDSGVMQLRKLQARIASGEDAKKETPAGDELPGPEPAKRKPASPKAEPKVEEAPVAPVQHYCPQCGWDVHDTDVAEIDDNDKFRYVLAVASGKRFTKTYQIFGGKLSVTFRTLLTREERLIMGQINRDSVEMLPVFTELHLMQLTTRTSDYRMALSIEAFANSSGITECPEYEQLDFDKPADSIREMHAMIVEDLLATDIVADAVRRAYGKFAAIQRWMLDNANNQDFF